MIVTLKFSQGDRNAVLTLESGPAGGVTSHHWDGDIELQSALQKRLSYEDEMIDGWLAVAHGSARQHELTLAISYEGDDWLMPSEVE